MGCGGCGAARVLPGALSSRNRVKGRRVRGYSGSGIIKSQKRLLREAAKLQAANKASVVTE